MSRSRSIPRLATGELLAAYALTEPDAVSDALAAKTYAELVERDTPGVSLGPEEQKLGLHGSSTRAVILEDAQVPAANVLGAIGWAHKIALNIVNIGRFKLGCGSLGVAKECLSTAIDYGRNRSNSGNRSSSSASSKGRLADMGVRIFVADGMGYRTAGLIDEAIAPFGRRRSRVCPGRRRFGNAASFR